jgi:hypothetical protein
MRPLEKRALGLVLREAERRGLVEAPLALARRTASLGFADDDIDRAFELFVSAEGRTIGGTLQLGDLDGAWIGRLAVAGAVGILDCEPFLTSKGAALLALFGEYSKPRYRWKSLIGEQSVSAQALSVALYRAVLIDVWAEVARAWHDDLTDRYRMGLVKGVEAALAAADGVLLEFGIDADDVRSLFDAEEVGRG